MNAVQRWGYSAAAAAEAGTLRAVAAISAQHCVLLCCRSHKTMEQNL